MPGWTQMIIYALLLVIAGGVWWVTTKRAKEGGNGLPSWLQWLSPSGLPQAHAHGLKASSHKATTADRAQTNSTSISMEISAVLDDIYREFMAETNRLSKAHERSHAELLAEVERLRQEVAELKGRMPNERPPSHPPEVPKLPVNPYRATRALPMDESLPMSVILDTLTAPERPLSKPAATSGTVVQQSPDLSRRTTSSEPSTSITGSSLGDRYMEIFDELQKGTDPKVIAHKLGIGVNEVTLVQRVME